MDDETRDLSDWWGTQPQEYRVPMDLPKALEAERAALGALLMDPRLIGQVSLAPEHLYLDRHRWVFQALLALREKSNVLTVHAWLEERGMAETIGGLAYLTGLDLLLPDLECLPDLVAVIREKAVRRRCIEMAFRTARAAATESRQVTEIIAETLAGCRGLIAESQTGGGFRDLADILEGWMEVTEANEGRVRETGLKTGISDLDELTGGMERRHMWLVAARPGLGKTSMLLQILGREALDEGRHVALFSLEMDEVEVALRLAGQRLGKDTRKLRMGALAGSDWTDLIRLAREVRWRGTVHVDQQARIDPATIGVRVEELANRVPLSAVFVDYLTLIRSPPGSRGERHDRVAEIADELAGIAKSANVKMVLAAQLTRDSTKGSRRPTVADMRGAGEEPAWGVVLLHREQRTTGEREYLAPETECIVAKNRTGLTGIAQAHFHGPTQRFLP